MPAELLLKVGYFGHPDGAAEASGVAAVMAFPACSTAERYTSHGDVIKAIVADSLGIPTEQIYPSASFHGEAAASRTWHRS